jgi:translation elongation factor EF-G
MKMKLLRQKRGDIVGDINRRRGQVNDIDRAGAKTIKADAIIENV